MQTKEDAKEFIDQQIAKLKREKENLIEKEEIKNKEALELSEKLENLYITRDKIEKNIIETQKNLYKLCTHEKLRKETRYVSGGYLNKSQSITTYYCELCGIKVDEQVQYGSYE